MKDYQKINIKHIPAGSLGWDIYSESYPCTSTTWQTIKTKLRPQSDKYFASTFFDYPWAATSKLDIGLGMKGITL